MSGSFTGEKIFFPLFYRVITISLNVSSTTCLAIRLKLIHLIFTQRAACMGKILVIRVEGEPASAENRVVEGGRWVGGGPTFLFFKSLHKNMVYT